MPSAQHTVMYPKPKLAAPSDLADRPERDRRILQHLGQVKLIASRIHDKLPESVCLDDLISAGVLGLIDAVDHFDETLNVKLKTYAEHKIRGAILDSLRSLDWAPRNKRRKSSERSLRCTTRKNSRFAKSPRWSIFMRPACRS